MKKYILILFAASLITLVIAADENKYARKFDDTEVDKILQNNRVLTSYIRCLLDKGPCTAEGRELKKILPDALSTNCSKCDDNQKTITQKVIKHLKTKRSEDWVNLLGKYDPLGQHKENYEHL
ncbi:ejaculatory bulb-specific protein 3-like [Nylanderia fulva]|uniref:ejaculatory bulb-specific protein 3-like n=1 Tax=Nylanderia fulva TaxID=613905 RepID=UPI0010FBBB3A|nr:ejaculatory bulb-specific protein 3-like [Nylanderia fulva]